MKLKQKHIRKIASNIVKGAKILDDIGMIDAVPIARETKLAVKGGKSVYNFGKRLRKKI